MNLSLRAKQLSKSSLLESEFVEILALFLHCRVKLMIWDATNNLIRLEHWSFLSFNYLTDINYLNAQCTNINKANTF